MYILKREVHLQNEMDESIVPLYSNTLHHIIPFCPRTPVPWPLIYMSASGTSVHPDTLERETHYTPSVPSCP
jgi:hypothetical protein